MHFTLYKKCVYYVSSILFSFRRKESTPNVNFTRTSSREYPMWLTQYSCDYSYRYRYIIIAILRNLVLKLYTFISLPPMISTKTVEWVALKFANKKLFEKISICIDLQLAAVIVTKKCILKHKMS